MSATLQDAGADLAAWARTGDQTALDRVLAHASDAAHLQAYRLLGRASDADDATQEALVQLVRSAKRYDPQLPFRPWLARIVHDACCRLLRSGRRRQRHEGAMPPPPPPPADAPVDSDVVRAAVLELPEALRAAVELHYFAGLDQADTATALGIGVGACAMRLSRARERLRDSLRRRGIGVSAAVALAMLTAAPAQAAPLALASGVAAQAAARALPTTTIPLTAMQTGTWFMITHPTVTMAAACGLAAVLVLPFAWSASEPPPPAPAVQPAPWSDAGRALLPYLDPQAAFRLAIDLDTLRPRLLTAKPFSMLSDPRAVRELAAWRTYSAFVRQQMIDKERLQFEPFAIAAEQGRALTLAMHDRGHGVHLEGRMLMLCDFGSGSDQVGMDIAAVLRNAGAKEKAPPPIGPFAGLLLEDGRLFLGRDGTRFALGTRDWLAARIHAPQAVQPPASAWFRFDASALLARYAALAGPTGDPAMVAPLLGSDWRTLKPVVEGSIDVVRNEITGIVQVTGARPFSPLVPLSLLLGGTSNLPFGALAALPLRRPNLAVPTSPDCMASLSFGLTLPPAAQPFTASVPTQDLAGLQRILEEAWSGDLALEVRPGMPLPRAALVLGLRQGAPPLEVVRQLAWLLDLPQAELDRPGALPRSIAGFALGGPVSITAYPDRLVLTWNAESSEWPGIANASAPTDAPACAVTVDLPAAARHWWPLLVMAIPPGQRNLLPQMPVAADHLPIWQMQWDTSAAGCRIVERGLPLMGMLIAAACIQTVAQADPWTESQTFTPGPNPPPQPADPQDGF